MLTHNDRVRLEHMVDAMGKIDQVLVGYTEDRFVQDWQKQLIVERLLEIFGEAAAHLTPQIRAAYPNIPWSKMVGLRNVVNHQYFRIDVSSIWQTATHALPPIKVKIQNILDKE